MHGCYNTAGDTSNLEISVTSDFFTAVSGTVSYTWVNYAGAAITVGTCPRTARV